MKWLTQLSLIMVAALMRGDAFAAPAVTNLPENRILLFDDYVATNAPNPVWVHDGPLPGSIIQAKRALLPGTNHFHRTGWRLFSCRTGSAAYAAGASSIPPVSPATVPTYPAVASNLAANLRYDLDARIESPIFTNGAGTIYFEAVPNNVDYAGELTVEFATNVWPLL